VQFGPDGSRQLCYVGLGDIMIELVQPAHADEFQGTEARPLGISVVDVDANEDHFTELGIHVVNQPGRGFSFGGRQAVIRDPSGLLIEVRQWEDNDFPMSPDWRR
jgi:hypothetical protein